MRIFLLILFLSTSLLAEDCPFCRPEVIEKQEVYHSCYWRILIDYQPALPGHLLLVPIAHRLTRHDLTNEENQDLIQIEKIVHKALQGRFGNDIEDLQYEKNGPTLQSVNHFHIHVLPITPDQGSLWGRMNLALRLFVPPTKLEASELAKEKATYQSFFPPSETCK